MGEKKRKRELWKAVVLVLPRQRCAELASSLADGVEIEICGMRLRSQREMIAFPCVVYLASQDLASEFVVHSRFVCQDMGETEKKCVSCKVKGFRKLMPAYADRRRKVLFEVYPGVEILSSRG